MIQTEIIENFENALQANLPHSLELLRQMVAVNSFTANPAGVNAVGKQTIDAFAGLGFESELIQAADFSYGRHLVLTRPGRASNSQPAPKIGLISHLDTVYPEAEERDNDFHWRVSGKRIYGPGVYDIKGGTVMIYMILAALKEKAPHIFDGVTWVLLFNAAEEALVYDFGRLCLERLAGNTLAALVFEGSETADTNSAEPQYRLVVARKGMARFHLQVEGKAAHAGTAHNHGANAILQIADVIERIAGLTDYSENVTLNVGTIAGGTVLNRVPHQASAAVELRAFSPEIFAETADKVVAFNEFSSVHSADGGYPCQVHVDVLGKWEPWAPNSGSNDLLAIWQTAARPLGWRVLPQERGGLSDGNWTWSSIPTIDGLGPTGGNAHCSERSQDGSKDQEFVLPDSFVPKALLNLLAIVRLINVNNELNQSHANGQPG
jgi:glutamate carboxypeptidase